MRYTFNNILWTVIYILHFTNLTFKVLFANGRPIKDSFEEYEFALSVTILYNYKI